MAELIFIDPRFDALRNAIYHTDRRNFLDLLNRILNFIVIILGAGVAAKAANQFNFAEWWLEFGVIFVATSQLVFDFGSRARTHEFLQKRYYEMLSEMETDTAEPGDFGRKWSAKLLTVAADEPITMRAIDALAYNQAVDARTSDVAEAQRNRLHVSWFQRRLRHIIAFQAAEFLPVGEHQTLLVRWSRWWQRKHERESHGEG